MVKLRIEIMKHIIKRKKGRQYPRRTKKGSYKKYK